MNKELTKKWKDGTIEADHYYCRHKSFYFIGYPIAGFPHLAYRQNDMIEHVDEVVGTIPDYKLWEAVREQWKVLLKENKELKKEIGRLKRRIKIIISNRSKRKTDFRSSDEKIV